MIYLQVPADIYSAIQKVLKSVGRIDNIRWLQLDFDITGEIKPFLTYEDGRLKINSEFRRDGDDSKTIDLLTNIIKDLYEKSKP